ncbi:hypothetical protein B7494_g116 [Chlorociboria aeruginascens]|nr:hypothetical protein B7494_g116 [Chlorociboria aeruginascens]
MLPDSSSPDLYLTHPTPDERLATWTSNSVAWSGALSLSEYLKREQYLTTVPLAKDGGLTHWILVDKNQAPDSRDILASCETLRKQVLIANKGVVTQTITHGIGSVFCDPKYRRKGYASRMMKEVAVKLRTWQLDEQSGLAQVPFSILYSDIGKSYYAGFGWHPFPSSHIAFPPVKGRPEVAKALGYEDLQELCDVDVASLRRSMESVIDAKIHVALIPNYDQMQWHHLREDFISKHVLGECPEIKGALAGRKGARVWAIWTRSYSGPIDKESSVNALHILRLVIENEDDPNNVESFKAVLGFAQSEAHKWKLGHVELWNPRPLLKNLIEKTELEHKEEEREKESITSFMWYGEGSGKVDEIEWMGNEKYGWC